MDTSTYVILDVNLTSQGNASSLEGTLPALKARFRPQWHDCGHDRTGIVQMKHSSERSR